MYPGIPRKSAWPWAAPADLLCVANDRAQICRVDYASPVSPCFATQGIGNVTIISGDGVMTAFVVICTHM
jgi:hypothetical protein